MFYQFLAGATPEERDNFGLEDPSEYALLASSGCYRLPAGPFSDDAMGMDELRGAMRTLGFKAKHTGCIFSLVVAILVLGNLEFGEADHTDVSAHVSNLPVLEQAARLLGVTGDDLSQVLTTKTSYVRKDLYTSLLNAEQSAVQRDNLVRDLYAILFAFVVETANHKIAPATTAAGDPDPNPATSATQIILLDQAGYQTRSTAGLAAHTQSGFVDFTTNFLDELVHAHVLRHAFDDAVGYNSHMAGDGVGLPAVKVLDNAACVEMLRGAKVGGGAGRKPGGVLGVLGRAAAGYKAGKGGEGRDGDMVQDLVAKVGVHSSFVAGPIGEGGGGGRGGRMMFGINHYAGSCEYDASGFVERNTDLLDSAFVSLLRNSRDGFVAKLLSGPSLAAEKHTKDESIVVQAQVSSRPLRQPTPILSPDGTTPSPGGADAEPTQLDPTKIFPVTTQLNHTLTTLLSTLDRTHLWTLSCIRPNDSGSPNSFDKRRVRTQVRALALPALVARRSTEYVADYAQGAFCARYVPTMQGSEKERIRQCAAKHGWEEGTDYKVGHRAVWLSYFAWKMVEDGLRAAERAAAGGGGEEEGSMIGTPEDDGTEYSHRGELEPPTPGERYYNESNDNLLLTRTGTNGTQYHDANAQYAGGGLRTPNVGAGAAPEYSEADGGGWGSEWDKKGARGPPPSPLGGKEGGMVVNNAPNTLEEVPTSRSRRWWLVVVWACTGIIPSFVLRVVGRMKRPDIRLAWREKVTIFLLILLLNCTVIFYIVEFGRLLCPDRNKVWDSTEVAQHQGNTDFWVSIQGKVYDVSNFVHGDHSDLVGEASNGQDTLDLLAGQDLTYYFPPPLALACPGLVTNPALELQYQNFTPVAPTALHKSGATQSAQNTKLDQSNWYTAIFQPEIKKFYKGPLVWSTKSIQAQASDANNPR